MITPTMQLDTVHRANKQRKNIIARCIKQIIYLTSALVIKQVFCDVDF